MAIVPGYVSPQSSIQSWGPFLASHGIVTMTIGTNSYYDQPEDRRDALLDALITLKEENTRSGSPLLGNIDITSMAVGGWSMGGGGAQLAAKMDTTLKAVMALCPWLNTGQLTASDLNHPVPTLIFSGEADGVAPPASHADVHYNYTPQSTSKMLFEIASGNHSVANDPIGGGEYVGKIAVSWLKNFLVGDACYCPLVLDTPPTASKYLLNVECSAAGLTEEAIGEGTINYKLYPNPSSGMINLDVESFNSGTNYQIFSLAGAKIDAGAVVSQSSSISVQNLEPGIYIFNLNTADGSSQTRFVVQ
jgi:dienelactone hydrolase